MRPLGVLSRLNLSRLDDRTAPAVFWGTSDAYSGTGTLRDVMASASSGDVIQFSGVTAVKLKTAELVAHDTLTIDGGGPNAVTIFRDTSGSTPPPDFRILRVPASANLTLIGVQLSGGQVAGFQSYGGGIYNDSGGTLSLDNSSVTDNLAESIGSPSLQPISRGGGIYNDGTLTVTASSITSNSAYSPPVQLDHGGSQKGYGGGVWNGGTLTIEDSTITGNQIVLGGLTSTLPTPTNSLPSDNFVYGGGLYNAGTASLSNVLLASNGASTTGASTTPTTIWGYGYGGGVYNDGSLTVTNSHLHANSVSTSLQTDSKMYGGGVYNLGEVDITNSTLSDNQASGGLQLGGGVYNGGTLGVDNSTLSGNRAATSVATFLSNGFGGGVYNTGTATLTFSTVSVNRASSIVAYGTGSSTSSQGGGLYGDGFTLDSTIVAENTAVYYSQGYPFTPTLTSGFDIAGTVTSLDFNLIGSTDSNSGWTGSDILDTAPLLDTLQDNGGPLVGPTWDLGYGAAPPTHATLSGSPAVSGGNPSTAPTNDERGARRSTSRPTIGAYEDESRERVAAGDAPLSRFTVAPPRPDDRDRWGGLIVLD